MPCTCATLARGEIQIKQISRAFKQRSVSTWACVLEEGGRKNPICLDFCFLSEIRTWSWPGLGGLATSCLQPSVHGCGFCWGSWGHRVVSAAKMKKAPASILPPWWCRNVTLDQVRTLKLKRKMDGRKGEGQRRKEKCVWVWRGNPGP